MADRVISVRLRFETDQARRNAREMSGAVRDLGAAAEAAGRSTTGLSRMGEAVRGVGRVTAAASAVAAGGLATLAGKTIAGGIAYNKLEQTSRAALKTLTGSAAAATSQMEALREFGKTSPFPRQVWIAAQQQLLAFGMSAEKIIPTFSAIQDAVAAAGGSGQQIEEVVSVLAKVQSTGKVTAETLNELGYRGIDAATLIAEAMGTSAAQVREDIANQAISGVEFIDQLTAAMTQRFGGAAAGVKETWAGTTDRIKGAIRDIGSLLATPLVDPNGGGAAVEWGNAIADALRALEARLEPAITALQDRMEPAVQAVTERLQDLATWIKNADFAAIGDQIKSMLPALTGIAAGFTVMGAQSLPILDKMLGGIKPLPVALAAAAMASPELRQALSDLLVAAQPLLASLAQLASIAAGTLGPVLSAVAAVLQPVIAAVGFLANVFAALPAPIQMVIAAFVAWKALNLSSMFSGLTASLTTFRQQMKDQQSLAAMSGQQIGTMGAAYSVAASKVSGAVGGMRGALSGAAGFLGGPWGAAILTGIGFLTMFAAKTDEISAKQTGLINSLEAGTGAITEQTRAFVTNGFESSRLNDAYRAIGGNAADLTDAYFGNADALGRVKDRLDDAVRSGRLNIILADRFYRVLDGGNGTLDRAQRAAREKAAADQQGAGAAANNASAQGGLASAMNAVSAQAMTAAEMVQHLNGVMTGVFDTAFGAEQASDSFQSGLHRLSGAFAQNQRATEAGQKATDRYAESARRQADSLKQQAKIARETKEQLEDLAEAQRKAEQEAREAAVAARQRQLDELFGRQFDRASTMDAFRSQLAQAGQDIADRRAAGKKNPKEATPGLTALSGFSEGALENRERLRNLTQAAQAAIQAEKDSGASKARIGQVTRQLQAQLAAEAAKWGLNAKEVQTYTRAIGDFGRIATAEVKVSLAGVRAEFAEQRAEILQNSQEQMENARQQATTAAAHTATAAAVDVHTAALQGNSRSAVENRDMMRDLVKKAQDELVQLHLSGAGREELTRRGEELARQLEREGVRLGFTKGDVQRYTDAIRRSATEVKKFPTLVARADTRDAQKKMKDFVGIVKKNLKEIPTKLPIAIYADRQDRAAQAAARQAGNYATGGFVSGPGGPTEDKVPAWLSDGEYVINAKQTARHRSLLERINAGVPGYAEGGHVTTLKPEANEKSFKQAASMLNSAVLGFAKSLVAGSGPLAWARSQAGKPYIWGGVGPAGYDCSGFMSAITNVIQGRHPHARRFATGNFPTAGFDPGGGNFMIGSRRGNPGHMAGTLMGVNVESRGSDGVVVGAAARGARDPLFGGNVWHLRGYANGGLVDKRGDPAFDIVSPMGKYFNRLLGSYERGTDYVPMTGPYRLHKGEAVIPAGQNRPVQVTLTVRGDGSREADFVVEAIHRADATGRLHITANRG